MRVGDQDRVFVPAMPELLLAVHQPLNTLWLLSNHGLIRA